jgi:glutathione synthase/RimK-type ligase-like ATP-grasp enzyme
MRAYLSTQGAVVEFLDSTRFPAELQIAYDPATGGGSIRFDSGRSLEFAEIQSVYWRNYGGVMPIELPDAEQAFIAANDARSLFESLLLGLEARWVNGLAGYRWHQTKPAALARVAALGMKVPATVVTNDPQAVLAFVDRHGRLENARCIFKPVQGGAHTERVDRSHLSEQNLASLTVSPVTIQEEVPGTDVRVFVAGSRVLACEIRTEVLDFRNDPGAEIVAIDVPSEVAATCCQIAAALDLVWTGIDLRRTPEDQYVFLEANPSPMFLGFERRSGLPLTESLAELLLQA